MDFFHIHQVVVTHLDPERHWHSIGSVRVPERGKSRRGGDAGVSSIFFLLSVEGEREVLCTCFFLWIVRGVCVLFLEFQNRIEQNCKPV